MIRTHNAGQLRPEHVGTEVTLAGWVAKRRDLGGVAFIDLRDASGIVQVVVRDDVLETSGAHALRNEFCIKVTGVVEARSADTVNPANDTGEIEVFVDQVISENPDMVEKIKGGQTKTIQAMVGQVMKKSKGKANPQMVNELIAKKLGV